MADPLDALRQPVPPTPVVPRPAFAAALRAQVEAALRGDAPAPGAGTTAAGTTPLSTPLSTSQTTTEREDDLAEPRSDTMTPTTSPETTRAPIGDPADAIGLTTTVSVTPYLRCRRAAAAIDFYVQAFGAVETMRLEQPDGRVGHAELRLGESVISLADEFPEMNIVSPLTLGGTSVSLTLEVPNCDQVVARAVAAGARVVRELADQFYGYRSATIADPFGHQWTIQTKREDLSNDQMQERLEDLEP